MIKDKKILVVGAGNAGRPAANLLNYLGNEVRVSDMQDLNSLPKKARKKIKELEKKGVVFELGTHIFDSVLWADALFISPNIPENADIRQFIEKTKVQKEIIEITTTDIGEILNELIKLPMVGIAGTDGKTTTTNMIDFVVGEKFNTLVFSSLQDSLVIEGLVDLVVHEKTRSKEMAIFELPHGTIRMAQGLEICAGVLTNLTPDHMDEFHNYEDYIQRNYAITDLIHSHGVMVLNGNDPIISHRAQDLDKDHIFYGMGSPQTIEFEGNTYSPLKLDLNIMAEDIQLKGLNGSAFTIKTTEIPTALCEKCGKMACECVDFHRKFVGPQESRIDLKVPGSFNIENALATVGIGLILGLDLDYLKEKLEEFSGVKGRFEKIDQVSGVNIFMDAAHNPESMEKLLTGLELSGRLIISVDNPDTLTIRDKYKIGHILGENAHVVIASAKNETTEVIDWEAAREVARGAEGTETYLTETVYQSLQKALQVAAPGDTILHIGPGVVNAYHHVKKDIKKAIQFFADSQAKIVVIGGCGTVGSLMARILNQNGAQVTVSDSCTDTPLKEVFLKEGIHLDLGGHSESVLKEADTIVMAPSLLNNEKLLAEIKKLSDADIISVNEILSFYKVDKPVIGVTGTNGKTTTTHILKNILKLAGHKIPEHYMSIQGNTELIPALQSRLNGDMAVVEIGTFGNPDEIKNSAINSEVNVGIITNISRDHIDADEEFTGYINCKKEIRDVAEILILNADDPLVANFSQGLNPDNVVFYGIDSVDISLETMGEGRECPQCDNIIHYKKHYLGHLGDYSCICDYEKPETDVKALKVRENSFILSIGSEEARVTLKTGGICNVYNALAAAAGAVVLGIDFEDIVRGIEEFKGVEGRFEEIHNHPQVIVDYAHNPAGVKAVLQTVNTIKAKKGKLIVVNTISSESGLSGDREIAQILNGVDMVVPASYAARYASNYIKTKTIETRTSKEQVKVGTLGASKEQVKEALKKALNISLDDDIILIIGEGGVKYSKEILAEISI